MPEQVVSLTKTVDQGAGGSSAWKVDGSAVTQPVSGPVTQAQLETELDEKLGDLGQKNMAGSAPVVLASDQTSVPVTVGNFPATQAVSEADGANVALGSTADTTTANTLIGRIKNLLSRWPSLIGQRTKADSLSVTFPSDADPVPRPPIVKSTNNSTTATLGASATYTGTADSILGYQQINLKLYATPSTAQASLFFEFSDDGTNWDISVPIVVRNPALFIPYPLINVGAFYRIRYLNDGGASAITALGTGETAGTPTAQTVFRLTSYLLPQATKELARTLDQSVSGSDPVALGRTVIMGRQPGGTTYVNTPASGPSQFNNTTAALGANATFTGGFETCDGWVSLAVEITTDQPSATNGIVIELSEDGSTVKRQIFKTLDSSDVSVGSLYFGATLAGSKYFRLKYTNGTVAQGSFFLKCYLSILVLPADEVGLNDTLLDSTEATIVRAVIGGKSGGTYQNVLLGTSGGLQVDINQYEAAAPIKALTSWAAKHVAVGTAAVQLDSTPLTNRKSIEVRALNANGNAQQIYIGPNNGVTAGNGRELVANEAVTLELDGTASVWAIGTQAGLAVSVTEIAGTP